MAYFPFHWHYHPEYELVLMSHCDGHRIVGDHMGDFGEEDLVLIGPNLTHSFDSARHSETTGKHQATVFHFSDTFLGNGFLEKPEFVNIQSLLEEAKRGVLFAGPTKAWAIPQIQQIPQTQGIARLFKFLEILDQLGQSSDVTLLASEGYTQPPHIKEESNIDRMLQYIQQNFTHDIKLDDAADWLNMSVPNFCQFFKKTTRTTFNAYLNDVRIGNACKLLIETDLTISEICFSSGFNSLSNFNRRFLHIKNNTPKTFRQKYRKKRKR